METHILLITGSLLLSCGCIGMLIVRFSNPFLKGIGCLGATFAVGALGAIAFALDIAWANASLTLAAGTLILLAFVLMHACFLELNEGKLRFPKLGAGLLVVQGLVFFISRFLHDTRRLSAMTLGVLVAIQACQSAVFLKRTHKTGKMGMDAPAWYSVAILTAFAAYNIFRSGWILVASKALSPHMPNPLEATSAIVYLGTALGLGFGVFWMAETEIRLKLEKLANIDPLTGIYNRRSFIALCEQELLRSSRSGEVFSLLMFDLDHFKKINDRYGHGVGDAVLCAVVEKLRNAVRNIDTVGRWGGEEFVALLPKADADAALIVARRLRNHVESISMPASPRMINSRAKRNESEKAIPVTISIGVATYTGWDTTTNIHDLFHQCDTAMYQAKADGRNRIVSINTQLALGL